MDYSTQASVASVLMSPDMVSRVKEMLRGKVFDSRILDEEDLLIWPATVSNDRLDTYFTRMSPRTLQNFAEDATAGVAFLNSHNHRELPFGKSVLGEYSPERRATDVIFYTLPGLNLGSVSTDNLYRGIRSGVVSDVSVGFYGGDLVCDVCGKNLFDAQCRHIPGIRAEVGSGKDKRVVTATATADGSRLAEVSAVFDGSTPGATIMKARQEVDAGRMQPDVASILENRYRINLNNKTYRAAWPDEQKGATMYKAVAGPTGASWAILRVIDNTEVSVAEVKDQAMADADVVILNRMNEGDSDAGLDLFKSLLAERERANNYRVQADLLAQNLSEASAEIARMTPLAQDGERYRVAKIDEALRNGVRAMGSAFNQDSYRQILLGSPIDFIEQMADDFGRMAEQTLGTTDKKVQPPTDNGRRVVEDENLFRV